MSIKSILFPTDFLAGSQKALPYAVDMAKMYGVKLYVVHIIQDLSHLTGWSPINISHDEVYREIEDSALEEIDAIFEGITDFHNFERVVIKGDPAEEILNFAKEKKACMIVMGTHGKEGLNRLIFGSTTDKIVRHAECPVLTVRSHVGN